MVVSSVPWGVCVFGVCLYRESEISRLLNDSMPEEQNFIDVLVAFCDNFCWLSDYSVFALECLICGLFLIVPFLAFNVFNCIFSLIY